MIKQILSSRNSSRDQLFSKPKAWANNSPTHRYFVQPRLIIVNNILVDLPFLFVHLK